ncbi:gephyrin-like molybdotransferase Glp [Veillonella agrestimuris]|uniref:molybdopterin molybdotransferase MoeA n=1 Tax=Veillonella agrestimuris TaxID=2941340 RepID=UPI00203BE4BA|nr:gephyrin-like molybdotransferase Glp [Veillonella agrestimuris]
MTVYTSDVAVSLEVGIRILQEAISPITEIEHVALSDALHRVAGEDITAHIDNPPFHRSPVDGYALRSVDTISAGDESPVLLTVVGEICAGAVFEHPVHNGEAIRIMTGAPIPNGCDAVVPQELVELEGNTITLCKPLKAYENYCIAGEDIKRGTIVIRQGETLTVAHIGVLATLGHMTVPVYRRLKVALASIGEELLPMGAPLEAGKVYNSNMYMLQGRLQELGCHVTSIGILSDDVDYVANALRSIEGDYDVVITTGAVSVGKKDIMHDVVPLVGEKLFWRLQLKPGSPVLGYRCPHALGIALSGNPFAALATFELLVRPILAHASRNMTVMYKRTSATMANEFTKLSKGRRFIRAYYDGQCVTVPEQNSPSSLLSAINCNALIDVPPGTGPLQIGELVEIVLL